MARKSLLAINSPMLLLKVFSLLASCEASHARQAPTVHSATKTRLHRFQAARPWKSPPSLRRRLHGQSANVRITRILERAALGTLSLRLKAVDGDITPEAIAPYRDWLAPHFLDDNDAFLLSHQSFHVQSMGKKVIVDTSAGESPPAFLNGITRFTDTFLDDLSDAGFPRESVDIVVATHLHADHVGWNTIKSGSEWVPTFPNALYIMSRGGYESLVPRPRHLFTRIFRRRWRRSCPPGAPS
jgi:hypothetical protein